MIARINRIAIILLIVSAALYFVLMNRETATVFFSNQTSFSLPLGLILIISFVAGLLGSMLLGIVSAIRTYFREKGFIKREKEYQHFYQQLLEARVATASHQWSRAKSLWQKMVRYDPTDVIARIELSKSLEAEGDLQQALKELDLSRRYSDREEQAEVLLRAAELNIALNNKTAAIDNLALLIANNPSKRALTMARDLSEQIDRYQDALEYHKSLCNFSEQEPEDHYDFISRIETKIAISNHDQQARSEALNQLYKKFPDCELLLRQLSKEAAQNSDFENAASLMVKTALRSGYHLDWSNAVDLWLKVGDPKRALAAAKTACKECKNIEKVYAELALTQLEISLNMYEEALNRVKQLASINLNNFSLEQSQSENIRLKIAILRGALVESQNKSGAERQAWLELL